MTARVRRQYVDVGFGQMHIAMSGDPVGVPVVLLHQTPRSWDEFTEVLDLLSGSRWSIAVDLPGMGGSDPHPAGSSIEHYAAGVLAAIDRLAIDEFDLVGHHTGGVVAIEVAAQAGGRVRRLVLSSTPHVDAAGREMRRQRPPIDVIDVAADGAHLAELWNRRRRFYPPDRPDLLSRFARDALRAADPEAGHRAVAAYEMEARVPLLTAKTLVVGHADDPYAFHEMQPLASAMGDVETAVIVGGAVPLEFTADRFAQVVTEFLDRPG